MKKLFWPAILLGVLVFWHQVPPAFAALPCDPTTTVCPITLSVTYDPPIATSSGFSVRIIDSNLRRFSAYGCVGSYQACVNTAVTNTEFWKSLGSVFYDDLPQAKAISWLRPNTTYPTAYMRFVVGGTFPSTQTATFGPIVTLPAYTPATTTVTNLQPTSATINWTTAFNGSTELTYGLQPPTWNEKDIHFSNMGVSAMTALSNGNVWALGGVSEVSEYVAGSGWTAPFALTSVVPTFYNYAMDSIGSNAAMVVGMSNGGDPGALWWHGSSWTALNPPGSNWLTNLHMSGPRTAWVVGSAEQIFLFDGTNWIDKSATSGRNSNQSFQSVFSQDDKVILVGGAAGRIGISSNGGTSWTFSTLPGASAFSSVTDISSIDGQTFWASGSEGHVWKCAMSAGVCTWSQVTIASGISTAMIHIIKIFDPNTILFSIPAASAVGLPGPLLTYNVSTNSSTIDATLSDIAPYAAWTSVFAANSPTDIFAGGSLVGADGVSTFAAERQINGTPAGDTNPADYSTSHPLTLTNLVAGDTYYYSAVSSDANITNGTLGTFTLPAPDSVNPTVAFTAPTTTTYTKNPTYTVTGTASDNTALKTMTLADNSVGIGLTETPDVTTNPASLTWSGVANLVAGTNTFVANTTDTSDNPASATAVVVYDAQAPALIINSPIMNSVQTVMPVAVKGTATDNNAVTAMDYQLNGGAVTQITLPVAGAWDTKLEAPGPTPVSGVNHLTVHAYDQAGNVATANVDFTYTVPTFSLAMNPSADQSVPIGQTLNYALTATPQNGFTSPTVVLSATILPAGMSATFTPASIAVGPANGTSSMSISTLGQNAGTYTVTITGVGGGQTATATVKFTLTTPPDFTISASPNAPVAPNFIAGQTGSYTISLSANSVFAGTIAISASGFQVGMTSNLSPSSVTLAANGSDSGTQISITTPTNLAAGSYSFNIKGTSGAISHSISVAFNVAAAPNIELTMGPAVQIFEAGSLPAIPFFGSVLSKDHFTGQVNLLATVQGGQTGLIIGLSRQNMALTDGSSVSFILDALATSEVPAGNYVIDILACAGTISGTTCPAGFVQQSTTVELDVTGDTTKPTITNISSSPNFDRVTISWRTDEPTTGVVTIYNDAALTSLKDYSGDAVCSATPCTHSVTISGLVDSTTYYFSISASDLAPTPNTSIATTDTNGALSFQTLAAPDSQPPVLTVTSPAASVNPTSIIGQVAIAGSATDDVLLKSVTITIVSVPASLWPAPDGGLTKEIKCATASCNPFSYNWVTNASIPNGTYQISVEAVDAAGNPSGVITRSVQLANDFSIPLVLAGPDAVVSASCGTGACSAVISWTTNTMTTSQVDYGITITSCDPVTGACSYPLSVSSDDTASGDPSRLMTLHHVTLNNLEAKQVYHFRITSCNGNGICTN